MSKIKEFIDKYTIERRIEFTDIPTGVGPQFEGERIRKPDLKVEFGGLKVKYKFELFRVKSYEEVSDGKITILGPDLEELEEGKAHSLGILIEAYGEKLSPEAEGVFERKIHYYINWIEGLMHVGSRNEIWIRLGKRAFNQGLRSFIDIGKVLLRLYKSDFPIIEKIQITFITDPDMIQDYWNKALKVYEERDSRILGLKDDDVDEFYGCILCQSFAPTHVCVITPERPSSCGAITWLDAKVAATIDPKGPIFKVPKGKLLDPIAGEYSGINEIVHEKSQGNVSKVYLHSALKYPHTSCGCFEAAVFYIPEVDGFGIIHRGYTGKAPNGLSFVEIANMIGGGKQVEGFVGVSVLYMKSRKFLQYDGGWSRVVWMPAELKDKVKEYMPKELIDKIATENDARNIEELREFLIRVNHPVAKALIAVKKEEVKPEVAVPEKVEEIEKPTITIPAAVPPTLVQVTLKNVKIRIEKMIIRKKEERVKR